MRLAFIRIDRHRIALVFGGLGFLLGTLHAPRVAAATAVTFLVGWLGSRRVAVAHALSRRRIIHAALISAGLWSMVAVAAIAGGGPLTSWWLMTDPTGSVIVETGQPRSGEVTPDERWELELLTAYLEGVVLTAAAAAGLYGLRVRYRHRRHRSPAPGATPVAHGRAARRHA